MPENYITTQTEKGNISISEDVIATIAATAIAEVDGIAGMSGSAGQELGELIGVKSIAKGIRVGFADDQVLVDAAVLVSQGKSITAVAENAQRAVTAAVEAMTGLKSLVNVQVNGVAFEK